MKKNDFTFIVGLTLLASVIWVIGEIIMGMWIAVYWWVPIVWRVLVVVGTLAVSVWHSFKYDEDFKNYDDDEKHKK